MAFRFEGLRVWQDALKHCNEIDLLTHSFPKHELYSLSSQIKRSADSVVLNIAEGSTGQSIPEYKRFLRIALRSGIEVVACLFIAKTRNYINQRRGRDYLASLGDPSEREAKEKKCRRFAPLRFYSPRFEKQAFHARETKTPLTGHFFSFAEREGFEPSIQV